MRPWPLLGSTFVADIPPGRPLYTFHVLYTSFVGKKGIGLGKRAASPSAPERRAKMAKMAEDRAQGSFRDRARQEYEERRAAGRLHPAQRTCATLDEKAGIQVRFHFPVCLLSIVYHRRRSRPCICLLSCC